MAIHIMFCSCLRFVVYRTEYLAPFGMVVTGIGGNESLTLWLARDTQRSRSEL